MDQMAGSQLSDPVLSFSMVDMTRPPDWLGREYIPRLFQDDYVRGQKWFRQGGLRRKWALGAQNLVRRGGVDF